MGESNHLFLFYFILFLFLFLFYFFCLLSFSPQVVKPRVFNLRSEVIFNLIFDPVGIDLTKSKMHSPLAAMLRGGPAARGAY